MDTLPVLVTGRTVRPRHPVTRLALCVVAALLAACSGGSDGDTTGSIDTTEPAVDITTDTDNTPPEPTSPDETEQAQEAEPPPEPPAALARLAWESMGGPPGAGRVMEFVQTTGDGPALYALTEDGIYSSTDRGEHWNPVEHIDARWVADITTSGDDLIACGDGVHTSQGTDTEQVSADFCSTVAADVDTIAVGTGADTLSNIVVQTSDPSSGSWQDHSPSAADLADLTLPPAGVQFDVQVAALLPVGDDLLAGIGVWAEGSGEHSNGGLYRWDATTGDWDRIQLETPPGAVVNELIADPQDDQHVFALFRHTLLHETRSPLSGLVFESVDGGATWSPLTDSSMESNGVADVVRVGSATYVLNPWDNYMLRIQGGTWDTVEMPFVADFPQFSFRLERLLIDPVDPNIAYGMVGEAWALGLLKSTDGMVTWNKMDTTIVGSSPTIVVSHPDDPSIVYTSGNVIQESYSTADGGATWQPFTPVTAGDELDVDPHHADRLLLVDESTHMYESLDGGATFTAIAEDFTSAKVLDVEVADDESGSVYVSNLGVGITRLGPGGPLHMSNSPDYAYDIEIDPIDPRIIYATNSPKKFEQHGSIWRYDPDQDSAFGWSEILRVENSAGVTSLSFDPSDPNTLYAGSTGATGTVWVSRDHGDNWSVLNPDLTFTTIQGHSQIVVDRLDDESAVVGTWGGGSFATSDGGTTWMQLDDTHTFSPTCLVAAPSDPLVIYACDRTDPKVHRSLDGGETWDEYFDFGPEHLTTTAIVVDPVDPDLIYASTFQPPAAMFGSLLKIRGGNVVDDIGAGLPRAVIEIDIDEHNPATLYVTTHLHGLFRSDDAGSSWQRLDDRGTGLPRTGYLDIDVDPTDSELLYATSLCGELPEYVTAPVEQLLSTTEPFRNIDPTAACGVYHSADRGETWTLVLETVDQANGIAISRANPDHVYAADAGGGVWASTDGGATWQQRNDGLATTSITGVAVGNTRIYATTQGSGVFTGTIGDTGQITWDDTRGPRAYVYRVQVEVDPSNPQRIYASAYPGGVLRSDDGGATWAAKNFLTPSIRVTDPVLQGYYALDIDPQDPRTVWLGVYGKGLIVSHDGRDFAVDANGDDQLLRGKHITSIAVDPQDSSRVLVGSEEGLFGTTDGGRSWSDIGAGIDTDDIRTLEIGTAAFAPLVTEFDDPGDFVLDAGWSLADGVLTGTGHTWARSESPVWSDYSFETTFLLSQGGLHVNARVSDDGRYFVAFGEGAVYLSKQFDGWEQFADLATATVNTDRGVPHTLRIELEGARIRVHLDGAQVIDFTDPDPLSRGGIAFESLDDSTVSIDRASVTPMAGQSQLYAGTGGYGLYQFDQTSQTWTSSGPTFGTGWWAPWERRMYQFSSIVFDPTTDGRVYYGHFPSGFFISDDGGHTWRDSSVGLGNDGMFSVTIHPSDPDTLFAGTYNGIVVSTDGGATWHDSSGGMPPEQWPYTVAIDDESPNVMYTSTKNGQNQGFCHRNSMCGVVMKSIDGGQTWQNSMTGLDDDSEYYTLLIHPLDHDTLFLSSSNGVYISLDAGDSWWPIVTGLPTTHNQVRDNVADNLTLTADHDTLLLGVVGHGLWRLDLGPLGHAG